MRFRIAFVFSFVTLGSALAQTTVTLQDGLNSPTIDNKIAGSTATTNFGTETESAFNQETSTALLVRFAIFQAEGGPVPNGATITSATLSLYKTWGPLTGDSTFKATRLLKNWNELQSSWNQAASGTPWQTPGVFGATDIAATPDGQGTVATDVNIWLNIDVTAGVQAFASGTPNFGWKVAYVSGGDSSKPKSFGMRDLTASNQQFRPKLTITYGSTPPPPPPPGGCASGSSRPYDQAPINGTPIATAASGSTTWEAEHFNCGAEGQAFHDTAAGVNAGQTFRADNEVEIVDVLVGGTPAGLAVNHFDTGEWMEYSINVGTAGQYSFGLMASHSPSTPGTGIARILVDGAQVGSDISVPTTNDWEDYRWFDTSTSVQLTAGTHIVRLFAGLQSYRIDKLRTSAGTPPPPPPPPPPPSSGDDCSRSGLSMCLRFESAEFKVSGPGCSAQPTCTGFACAGITTGGAGTFNWEAQNFGCDSPSPPQGTGDRSDDTSRIALTTEAGSRDDGSTAIKFTTQLRDQCVHTSECGTGTDFERSEMSLDEPQTGAVRGQEQWWAESVYFPSAFTVTPGNYNSSLFMQFHGTNSAANINMNVMNEPGGRLIIRAQAVGGDQYSYHTPGGDFVPGECIDVLTRNVWYDFVHRIVWSDNGTGVQEMWMRKGTDPPVKVLSHSGINTLFAGEGTYFKFGTYHFAQLDGSSSVIIDRIRRGNSFDAVANFAMPSSVVHNCNP